MIDDVLSTDEGLATVSPTVTKRTERTSFSSKIFELAIYDFDRSVFDNEFSGEDDADDSSVGDDDDDDVDKENKEILPPVVRTRGGQRGINPGPQQLRRSKGVPFQNVDKNSQSVIRTLIE